jgi:5-deoxy-5-amino-3-dehydroquinate synthase
MDVMVNVAPTPYDVIIGPGLRHELSERVTSLLPEAKRCVIVSQANIAAQSWFLDLKLDIATETVLIGDGEDAKSFATIEMLCRSFVAAGLSRGDLIVAVGGGLVSDVVGFAAAIYHRGIASVTVSTTLLGQIDAAIGGKTGINLPEGKNLVGTFTQPRLVICDTQTLGTLDDGAWRCGKGEMAKYAFLGDELPSADILKETLEEQVFRCVAIKADVVADDERESGRRMVLNYGHTLGHAIEAVGLAMRAQGSAAPVTMIQHGEAVAIGLAYAARLARRLGRIDDARVSLHEEIIAGFGLSATLPEGLAAAALLEAMARDKKAHHDLTFVLDGPRGVEAVHGVDPGAVLATLIDMGAKP